MLMTLYEFQFNFIPLIALRQNPSIIKTTRGIEHMMRYYNTSFNLSRFTLENGELKGFEYTLLNFSGELEEPEARYILVLKIPYRQCLIYTFEKGSEENYFLCSITLNSHSLYNNYDKEISTTDFMEEVIKLIPSNYFE